MLWHVRGSNLSFLGSVHIASKPFTFPPHIEQRLLQTDIIAFESNLDLPPDTTSGSYSSSGRLSQDIPEDLYREADQLWTALDLPAGNLERCRPWLAAFTLMNRALSQRGFDPCNGVDRKVLELGKSRRKSLFFLEDVNAGLLPFRNGPISEQAHFLANVVRNTEDSIRDVGIMIHAWEFGQPADLIPIAKKGKLLTPTIFAAAIAGRNRKWLPRLLRLVRSGRPALAVVGGLHMIDGPDSLPSLLEQHGYACELENF